MPSHAHVPGCARLNVMRLNAARLNYAEPVFFAVIGDVERSGNVRIEGAADPECVRAALEGLIR